MNVLMLRHSAGFEHSYLPDAEVAIKAICKAQGWSVCTTHLCNRISAEALSKVDLLMFATTGNLPMEPAQRQAILDFVKGGKGFFGIHNATDTFYDFPEYGAMIGGYFNGHPWTQEVGVIVEDPKHPATQHLGTRFKVFDEIYTFKSWDRTKTHVLMKIDNASVPLEKGNRPDHDYGLAWCHPYGQGRVFYTALGHPDELWHQDWFRQHILGGMKWATKLAD